MCGTGWGCAVQAESVQNRPRVCSTGWGCVVQAEGNSLLCIPQPILHTLSLYFGCASSCTVCLSLQAHPQPVLNSISLYWRPSACTSHSQPVLHILYTECEFLESGKTIKRAIMTQLPFIAICSQEMRQVKKDRCLIQILQNWKYFDNSQLILFIFGMQTAPCRTLSCTHDIA